MFPVVFVLRFSTVIVFHLKCADVLDHDGEIFTSACAYLHPNTHPDKTTNTKRIRANSSAIAITLSAVVIDRFAQHLELPY